MLKTIIWFGKCLFLYLIVAILAVRFSFVLTLPVWKAAVRFHWTDQPFNIFSFSYFLPIFAITGFVLGLLPWRRLTGGLPKAPDSPAETVLDRVPATLWAWLPVTVAFLVRYFTWSSRYSSVMDPHGITTGRFTRFLGTVAMQNMSLVDATWLRDRLLYTGPMLFLMAFALGVFLLRRIARKPVQVHEGTATP